MPLYIKDPDVSEMAERLRQLTRVRSKTEAVRKALAEALEAAGGRPSSHGAHRGGRRPGKANRPPRRKIRPKSVQRRDVGF